MWPNCPCSYWCKSPVLQYVIYFLLWDKLLTHFLEFPHNGNGSQTKLIRRDCPASRTIYVPEDPTIRKACITEPRKSSQPSYPSPNEDACHDKGNLQDLCEKCRNCREFCSDCRQWCVSGPQNMLKQDLITHYV